MTSKNDIEAVLLYNEQEGTFTWKRTGKLAGYTNPDGYVFIRINKKLYRAHRLVWLLRYGQFPEAEIDHVDGNPSNNRVENLRLASSSDNKCNTKRRKDNTSGVKGIHWYKAYKKWQVNICKNSKNKCLGYFTDIFEAYCVLTSYRNKLHGDFANNG